MLSVSFQPFPVLQTERLLLRRFSERDAEALFHIRSLDEVVRYLDRDKTASVEEALEMIRRVNTGIDENQSITWAISPRNEPGKLIGTIGFWRMDLKHHRGEVGYLLHSDFHRRGLMQEALKAALEYAFQQMQLHSVEAWVNPHNAPSIGLLEKNGFVKEAHFRENYYYRGRFLDSAVYSLLTPLRDAENV